MGDVIQGNTAVELNSENEAGILSPEQTAAATGTEAGEAVPDKFRNEDGSVNQDALLKSYLELESQRGQPQEAQGAPEEDVPAEETEEDAPNDAEEQAKDALTAKGIDPEAITADFYDNGEELSDEWYGKLAEAGYPKELVDTYVKGLQSQNDSAKDAGNAVASEIYAVAGDETSFKGMMDYFTANGGTQHADRYNSALAAQDVSVLKATVADMYVEYRAAEGVEPSRKVTAADAGRGMSAYRSFAEMKSDMADPRYRRDPAYRSDVEAKALRSKF